MLQTPGTGCTLSCDFRGSLITSKVAGVTMAARILPDIVVVVKSLSEVFVEAHATKNILAGPSGEGKTHRTHHRILLSLEELYHETFSLPLSWIMTLSSQFRTMKWNSNSNDHCSGSNRVRSKTSISRRILVDWSGLGCVLPME